MSRNNKSTRYAAFFQIARTPDSVITHGQRIWIEAICPTQGADDNADRVPDYAFGASVATLVPNTGIILRLRHAIETKFLAYQGYLAQDTVLPDDAFVVAVNGCQIPHARADHQVPRIVQSVLPIGDMAVVFNRDPSVPIETHYQYRRTVTRRSGTEIETDIFFQDRYRRLSAVLYSKVDAGNPTPRLGDDYVLIHNPRAHVEVERGTIKRGRELWVVEGDETFYLESAKHE